MRRRSNTFVVGKGRLDIAGELPQRSANGTRLRQLEDLSRKKSDFR